MKDKRRSENKRAEFETRNYTKTAFFALETETVVSRPHYWMLCTCSNLICEFMQKERQI